MHDFSTLAACKTSILDILNVPKGTDPSGIDYLLVNEWGGYRFGFVDRSTISKEKMFAMLPSLPGCNPQLFNQAVLQLLEEGKVVQYNSPHIWRGLTLQVLAGLPEREADFLPRHAAA